MTCPSSLEVESPNEHRDVQRARGPPTDWGELVQVHFRPGNQASPDELIDIHSL